MQHKSHALAVPLGEDRFPVRSRSALDQCEASSPWAIARGIAHDINNLLAVVSGNAELALRDLPDDSPAHDALCFVRDAVWEAQTFTRGLLSREQDAGVSADLNEVMLAMLPLLTRAVQPATRLVLHLGEALPSARIDSTTARRALLNLVLNASDAIGDGEGTITITTTTLHAGNRADWHMHQLPTEPAVGLLVRDTGCGMDAETLSRVYLGRFSSKGQGRGLGLSVVHCAAQESGGALAVRSAPGAGSEFALLLPTVGDLLSVKQANGTSAAGRLISRTVGNAAGIDD